MTGNVNKVGANFASTMLNLQGSSVTGNATPTATIKFGQALANQPAKDSFTPAKAAAAQTGVAAYPSANNLLNMAKAVASQVGFSGNSNKSEANTSFASRFLGSASAGDHATGLSADQRIEGKQGDKQFS